MIKDTLLIWRFKRGSSDALARIYRKYEGYLLTVAAALLNDLYAAEDVVHDSFVSFAESADTLKLEGSLKCYLATCVANRARDRMRKLKRAPAGLEGAECMCSEESGPELAAVFSEELRQVSSAMQKIPYEQREVIILHLRGAMTFRQIAKSQDVSVNTVQSRYRYGLEKLRSFVDSEVKK